MSTTPIIMMAMLTLAFSPFGVGGEKRTSGQEQGTRRSLPASGSWPEQWAERKLHRGEQAFVYARKKATADEALKVLRQVVEEARQDGVTKPAVGLIVVIDAREEFPLEIARLTEILNDPNTRTDEDKSREILNSIKEARKLSDQAGTDMNSLVAVLPIPLRPVALPKVAKELPEGIEQEIAWCLLVPTDGYVRAGMRAVMEGMVKIDKMNWKERLLIGALTPLAQREAEKRVRKARQADVYQLLVEGQKDWSQELRKEKVNAYRQKLGLDGESQPGADKQPTEAKQAGGPGSG
jgi:hypothetical protein